MGVQSNSTVRHASNPALKVVFTGEDPDTLLHDADCSEACILPEPGNVKEEALGIDYLEELGEGVTATVFRGHWRGMEVAVKEITLDRDIMSPKARVNLDRELAILQQVSHPNLVTFHGVIDVECKAKIITEFCGGGCLFDVLHNSDLLLTCRQKIKISADVASAMAYLHSRDPPIMHRDLKSLNLLLQKALEYVADVPFVKVTDFGLSRMLSPSGSGTSMTKDAGTCHWMAPEVFTSNSYDTKADVYSYSMILYEVICQEIPFADVNAKRLGLMVIRGERPDLNLVPDKCPKPLMDLMLKCWAADPASRPSFAEIERACAPRKQETERQAE